MGNLEQFRTFYFDHKYNAAGLETRVNARGKDVGGRTLNTYPESVTSLPIYPPEQQFGQTAPNF